MNDDAIDAVKYLLGDSGGESEFQKMLFEAQTTIMAAFGINKKFFMVANARHFGKTFAMQQLEKTKTESATEWNKAQRQRLLATSHIQDETLIEAVEIWVTPYKRFIHLERRLSRMVESHVGAPKHLYTHHDDDSGYSQTFDIYDMKDQKAIIEILADETITLRFTEAAKPRWGEDFWMRTNKIEAAP